MIDPGGILKRSSVPLSSLQAADEATIVEIEGPDSNRLAGFGLYPGMTVTVRQTFPSFVIKVEETEVALEAGVARKIQVLPTGGPGRRRRKRLQQRGRISGPTRSAPDDPDDPVETLPTPTLPAAGSFPTGRTTAEPGTFPRRIFTIAVIVVCTALSGSALHTFFTLRNLRTEYLDNRGHDIAALVDSQLRGPGRRFDQATRQQVLDSTLDAYAQSITFLAIVNPSGQVAAQAGSSGSSSQVFVFEAPLGGRRGPRWSSGSVGSATLQIGLRTEQAGFISSQAYIHLGISLAAVVLLAVLGGYFLKTLDRYLALQTREASERQLAQLGRLSATLAHEIRNPLGAMKGLTQLVQEDLPEDHRAHELMATVISEAQRLEKLVTDLLAFARPAGLSIQEVDIVRALESVITLLEPRALEQGIRFESQFAGSPLQVRADPDGLRQVLLNVLGNAIDATGGPGRIDLTAVERPQEIEISVMDRGCGLGSGDPEELFQPFRTTKTHGSGLGLAVSRQIVERLGGRISLENRSGGGAICRIRLPKRS